MKRVEPHCVRRGGVILTEAVVALALLGLVLAATSVVVTRYGRATDRFLNNRRVQLAAESQIEHLRAGTLPLSDTEFTDDAGITYGIRITHADKPWDPLRLACVTATFTGKHGKVSRCEISAYVSCCLEREGSR